MCYVGPHVGPLGWLVPHCLRSLSLPHEGSSQAPGPTWGPEVLGLHTFLLDFCGEDTRECRVPGRREDRIRWVQAHILRGGAGLQPRHIRVAMR